MEYDGFQEHFKDVDQINEFNYQNYYSDEDVYRQKVLEGYGYKFLRINKFNVGENPIASLDEKIGHLVKNTKNSNSLLANIYQTVEGLQNGDIRECPKCKEVRSLNDFKDSTLITGFGRFCSKCKGNKTYSYTISKPAKETPVLSDKTCPRCSAKMILRKGKFGKFYGCSKYPYCRGTK